MTEKNTPFSILALRKHRMAKRQQRRFQLAVRLTPKSSRRKLRPSHTAKIIDP